MMRCDHCRSLLLDHLYGLLEPADAAAVEEHLAGCPGCAAARDHEARAQGLIARAAKSEFPHVQFVAPAADVAPAALTAAVHQEPAVAAQLGARPEAEPATPGLTPGAHQGRPARRSGIIVGWAVAVSVLAGVAAAVLAVNGRVERANSTRDELVATSAQAADAEKALRQARHELTGKRERAAAGLDLAKRKHDQVLADWVTAEKATIGPAADRRLAVQVVKPAVIQPGAPNIFELTVLDTDRIVASTDPILAEVRDQTGKSVYAAQFNHDRQGRVGYLKLPAEVWTRVRPDDELFLAVATVDPKTGVKTDLQEPIRLFGPVYTTLLVTDRPSYRAGEPVYFRSLTLDRVTFRPPVHEQLLRFELVRKSAGPPVPVGTLEGSTHLVRVAGGKVEPVNGPDGKPLRGVGCGVFFLPPELPDGDYALTLTESPPPGGYPPAIAFPVTRTIQVRSGPAERYQKRIAFAAAGFAPGEEAEGWAELKSQDKPVPNVPVDVIAVVSNGVMLPVTLLQGATGPDGRVRFRVNLLKGMPPGEVRVKVTFQTPDRPEETAERVPLIGKNLIVEFFPEGGAMVAGVPCRVYVRATMPSGEPVDLRGVVTDGREVVVHVETLRDPEGGKNRGLGSFTFTPRLGGIYWLKLEAPAGPFAPLLLDPFPPREFPSGAAAAAGVPAVVAARTGFPLPPVAPGGVVMSVANPVTGPGQPFRVQLYSVARPRNLVVGAYTRGRLSDTKKVAVAADKLVEVPLMAGDDARGGVTRITVFEDYPPAPGRPRQELVPVAERLVFRRPGETLNLSLSTNAGPLGAQPGFAPGSPVDLTIRATDEKGNPTPAVLFATLTNAGGTANRKDRLLTTQFLIAGEIQNPDDLEYADFLLSDHPRAAEALDLVLATQGWRRMIEQYQAPLSDARAANAEARLSDPRERLLATNGAYPVRVEPTDVRRQQIYETYGSKYEAAAKELKAAGASKAAVDADTSGDARMGELLAAYEARRQELAELTGRAEAAAGWVGTLDRFTVPVVAALVVIALGFVGVMAIRQTGFAASVPLALAAAGLFGLAVFLVVMHPRSVPTDSVIGLPVPPKDGDGVKGGKSEGNGSTLGGAPPKLTPGGPSVTVQKAPFVEKNGPGIGVRVAPPGAQALVAPQLGPEGSNGPEAMSPQWPGLVRPMALKDRDGWRPGGPAEKLIPQPLIPGRPGVDKPPDRGPVRLKAPATADTNDAARQSIDKAAEFARTRGKTAADRINELDTTTPPGLLDREALNRVKAAVIPPTPLVVREYAAPRPGSQGTPGAEGPDTILWQPVIVLPGDGKTTLSFPIGDSPAGYEVIVAGHTLDGRIGATRGLLPVAPAVPAVPGPAK